MIRAIRVEVTQSAFSAEDAVSVGNVLDENPFILLGHKTGTPKHAAGIVLLRELSY